VVEHDFSLKILRRVGEQVEINPDQFGTETLSRFSRLLATPRASVKRRNRRNLL
jgi:hypothetical protein